MRTQEHLRYLRVQEAAIDEARRDLWRAGREVVERAHEIDLERRWSGTEIERAMNSADKRVREAARHSDRFGVAESLAAGPELIKTLRDARVPGSHPTAAAIVVAAVDSRRAGLPGPISESVLHAAHGHYLAEWGGSDLRPEKFDLGIEFATRPVYGITSMLLGDDDRGYVPHDYLLDRTVGGEIPEAVFDVLLGQADAFDAYEMGKVAFSTWRLDRAEKAFRPAAAAGHWHAAYLLAASVRESGRPRDASRLLQDLLARHTWTPADRADELTTRAALARCLADSGEVEKAIALYKQLIAEYQVPDMDAIDALATRHDYAYWLAASGRIDKALVLLQEIYKQRHRILGPDHPDTLTTRHNLARWTGEGGDPAAALASFRALLHDRLQVLGPDHPSTLATRAQFAFWLDHIGNHEEALSALEILLADRIRVLGISHPKTLMTRELIGRTLGTSGDAPRAVAMLQEVLVDRVRIMGQEHPATLVNRNQLARWTRTAGHAAAALTMGVKLVDDDTRILGITHPTTLHARHDLALAFEAAGDLTRALATITGLSRDVARALRHNGRFIDQVKADQSRITDSVANRFASGANGHTH